MFCFSLSHDVASGQRSSYLFRRSSRIIPALKAAGIPRIKFYSLRYTTASLMIAPDENIKYIRGQLSHSSPTVTLYVYAHMMKPVNQEAACRLENTILK